MKREKDKEKETTAWTKSLEYLKCLKRSWFREIGGDA